MYNFVTNIDGCLSSASSMVWGNIGIIYYSHIPVIIILLFVGILVLVKSKSVSAKPLFMLNLSLALWTTADLITWISSNSVHIMFFWSILGVVEGLILVSSFYFSYTSIYEKYPPLWLSVIPSAMFLPVILMTPFKYNLSAFDFNQCTAIDTYFLGYMFIFEIAISVLIFLVSIVGILKTPKIFRTPKILITLGLTCFLILYFLSGYLLNLTGRYDFQIYGFIGMVIFSIFLTYIIVKFKSFNIKLVGSQVLVWALILLIGSQFFFIKVWTNYILNGITFIGVIIFGYSLIKSVKREIEQRENLEKLRFKLEESNLKLEYANDKLKDLDKLKTEFLGLASHQLRSPLTAIKGYSSMLIEGDYGDINKKAKETVDRILQSSNNLTLIVEDLLNVSKIEQGGMKYEMAPFDMVDVANEIAKSLSITAEKKGIKLTFDSEKEKDCFVNGDKDKLRQVIINFIDNSIKYTKTGSIKITVKKIKDKVVFAVKDTGMGMTPEVRDSLFHKFARGDGAKMNTSGSGLGLYLAAEIAKAHKGRVWAESDGPNKGSTFLMELDAVEKA